MITESKPSYFSDSTNNALLRKLLVALRTESEDKPEGLIRALTQIINLMISNPDKFDEFASVNIEWIGQNFIQEISNYLNGPTGNRNHDTQSIFTSAYRFLCELEFTQPGNPSIEVLSVINFVHENLSFFESMHRQQLVYAAYAMPAQIAKKLIHNPSIVEFRNFSKAVESAQKLKSEWDSDIEKRQKLLHGISDNIKNLTSEYNFVGLVNGFTSLKSTKEVERKVAFCTLIAIGALMLILPVCQIIFVINKIESINKYQTTLVYSLPTIIAVEVILLYFFRVVLSQFKSVKAQLLQVDLRISLCQFIESYAEYVSKIREKDSSALSKFEALIFSGLVTDESGIPSTFDGIEQVASLIRSLRGESK